MKKFESKLLNLLKKDTKPKVVAIKGEPLLQYKNKNNIAICNAFQHCRRFSV